MEGAALVAIAGGGPVGLVAGHLLTALGVPVVLLERNATTSDEAKAISLDDTSLRTLQAAGLADEVAGVVVPGFGTEYRGADGRVLFRAGAPVPYRLGHPFKSSFAQPELERLLLRELRARPLADVRFATEVTAVREGTDGIAVTARDVASGREETITAAHLLACDGGRSTVRALLDIAMAGRSHEEPWLVADTVGDPHRERYGMHHGVPDRPTVVIPGRDGRCRYEFLLRPGEGRPGETPSPALLARLLAPHRGEVGPADVERAIIYRFHALVATRWRRGRAFLLGDAAHMMPPFAGQGLNSGVRDAANLCWKVAGVVRGDLDPVVLDSYEPERRPHAEATVRLSQRLGRIVMTTHRRRARVRDAVVRGVLRTGRGRDWLEHMRYRPSPLVTEGLIVGDPGGPVGLPLDQPRVFDATAHRVVLLDEVLGDGWALLGVDLAPAAWASVTGPALARLAGVRVDAGLDDRGSAPAAGRIAIGDVDGALQRALAPLRGSLLLVRPDRVVAARFTPADAARIDRTVATWLPAVVPDPRPAAVPAALSAAPEEAR